LQVKTNHSCIELVCDGGARYGVGHVRRSLTLTRELIRRGNTVQFYAASEHGQQLLSNINISNPSDLTPALRVLDFPYPIEEWVGYNDSIPTVALDYFGEKIIDLVISVYEHRIPVPCGRRLSGLEYALIRPEITLIAKHYHVSSGAVLVMIGGSDINQDGARVAEKLVQFGVKVQLIRGPGVEKDYQLSSESISVLHVPDDIERRMASCAWAVTNGGSSMMEMMCLGKAVHVVPQTEAELHLAEIVLEKGAVLGIGLNNLKFPSQREIEQVGQCAKGIVDGFGVKRVADLIEGCILDEG